MNDIGKAFAIAVDTMQHILDHKYTLTKERFNTVRDSFWKREHASTEAALHWAAETCKAEAKERKDA